MVFIDCRPNLGNVLSSSLLASDYVLVPCMASAMGLEGLAQLYETVMGIKESFNPKIEILGVVMNFFMPRRALATEAREVVEASPMVAPYVFKSDLNNLAEIAQGPVEKLPVVLIAPRSKGAQQINAMVDEFLGLLGKDLYVQGFEGPGVVESSATSAGVNAA
jgi:chromosome partitioning protein